MDGGRPDPHRRRHSSITLFAKEFRGYNALMLWFAICLLGLSPIRYLFFLWVLFGAYGVQSWSALLSTMLLGLYVPIVFGILFVIGVGLPFIVVSKVIGDRPVVSFDRGVIGAIVFPLTCILSTYLFYLALPLAAWTIRWVNPGDVIKATNGPAAFVHRFVAAPLTPTILPDFFEQTPQQSKDLVRCHVATTYLSTPGFWFFVKKQYPAIYEAELRRQSK